eukprot:jgi/Bigna1/137059/aug1.37_g11767
MSATANSKFRPMEGGADVISTTTTWSLATVSELLSDWPENRSMYLEAVDRDDEMGIDEQLESETSSSTIESTSDEDQYSDGDLSELYIASKILAREIETLIDRRIILSIVRRAKLVQFSVKKCLLGYSTKVNYNRGLSICVNTNK